MVKLLGILTLVLALVLFPPAALALVSNNAVPGDATYPIKRSLEDIIYAIASFNPVSKAWFSAARSNRRFEEATTLLASGKEKQISQSLQELVVQTQIAAEQAKQIQDPVKRQEAINQIAQSIQKYSQGLEQANNTNSNPAQVPTQQTPKPAPHQNGTGSVTSITVTNPQPTIPPTQNQPTSIKPTPVPQAVTSTVQPTSAPAVTAQPTVAAQPSTPQPVVVPQPTAVPAGVSSSQGDQINQTIDQLQQIGQKLQQSSINPQENSQTKSDEGKDKQGENKDSGGNKDSGKDKNGEGKEGRNGRD